MSSNSEPLGEAPSPPPTPSPFQRIKLEHERDLVSAPRTQDQAGEEDMDLDQAPHSEPKDPPVERLPKSTYRGRITMAQILEYTKPGVKCSGIARALAEAMKVKEENYFILVSYLVPCPMSSVPYRASCVERLMLCYVLSCVFCQTVLGTYVVSSQVPANPPLLCRTSTDRHRASSLSNFVVTQTVPRNKSGSIVLRTWWLC